MRALFIIPLVLMSLVSFPSWGLTYDDLVKRAGLYYEKFTATPFTGEVDEGRVRGSFKNGQRDGFYETYHENGQLMMKGEYKNGELVGSYEIYHDNGQLHVKVNLKNGKWEGYVKRYWEDGTVDEEETGTYKNGVKISD